MNLTIAQVIAKLPEALKQTAGLQRGYREAGIAKRRACTTAWQVANPVRSRAIQARSKAHRAELMRLAVLGATPAELDEIAATLLAWKADPAWLCAYCGKPAEAKHRTADHVIAISKGGAHHAANLKPACRSCNSRKGTASYYFA